VPFYSLCSNPYRELCARKGQLGRPVDLFVLLHISHCPEGVKQAPGRLVESILIYRRSNSGSLATFIAIRRASSFLVEMSEFGLQITRHAGFPRLANIKRFA
jgi:hypothetical protein